MNGMGRSANDSVGLLDNAWSPLFLASSLFHISVGLTAIVGNCLIILTHVKVKEVRNAHNFIPALAVADMIAGCGFVFNVAAVYAGVKLTHKLCSFFALPYLLGSIGNMVLNLAIALYRLVAFRYPSHVSIFSKRPILIVLYILITAMFVFFAIKITSAGNAKIPLRVCTLLRVAPKLDGLVVIIPPSLVVATITFNCILFWEVKKKRNAASSSTNTLRRDIKLAESMLIITAIYVVTNLLASAGFHAARMYADPSQLSEIEYLIISPIGSMTFAANYLVYACRSSEYRQTLACKTISNQTGNKHSQVQPKIRY